MPVPYAQYTPTHTERRGVLLLDIKLLDKRVVTALVLPLKVLEVHTAVRHHAEKPPAGMNILRILLEVGRKLVDAAGQQTNLNFRRTGIGIVAGDFFNDVLRLLFRKHMYTVAHIVDICKSPSREPQDSTSSVRYGHEPYTTPSRHATVQSIEKAVLQGRTALWIGWRTAIQRIGGRLSAPVVASETVHVPLYDRRSFAWCRGNPAKSMN